MVPESRAVAEGARPVTLVRNGHHQVWRPTLTMVLVAVPLTLVGGIGGVVRPGSLETWAGTALFSAVVVLLAGLLSTAVLALGSGHHRVVDTAAGLRLHRWWGTREIAWGDVERVVVEDGTSSWLWNPTDTPPRVVVVAHGGRRWRVPFRASGDELAVQRQRLAMACATRSVEVSGAAVSTGERRAARSRRMLRPPHDRGPRA